MMLGGNDHSWLPRSDDNDNPAAFMKRNLPFVLTMNTVIALLITILGASWKYFIATFIISQCIGLTILILLTMACFLIIIPYGLGRTAQLVMLAVLIPSAGLLGAIIGRWLTGRGWSFTRLTEINWTVSLVFAFVGTSVALMYGSGKALLRDRQARAERAERAAVEAQLRALQAQIEPHFLFNTLANLDALMAVDVNRAREMLNHLIRYLRAALTHSRSGSATLRTEIELLKSYLAIMELRLPDRLRAEFHCDERCLELAFPPMLLQPLVENAITHGVEPSRSGGIVRVIARCDDEELVLDVEDTGVGLGQSPSTGTGAGIENIRSRLKSLYGSAATLQLEPLVPHGTRASIRIPRSMLKVNAA